MKTLSLRVWVVGVAFSSLTLLTGCKDNKANAEIPIFSESTPAYAQSASAVPVSSVPEAAPARPAALAFAPPLLTGAETAPAQNAAPPVPAIAASTNSPGNALAEAPDAASHAVAAPAPSTNAQPAAIPKEANVSPALAEVIKMLESGISEEVVLSYITNAPKAYNVNSDTVIYLNDLGVSSTVMTALIQQDASPESAASKAAASAVQPLPPGVALTTPATNVYLPTINSLTAPPAAPGYVAAAPAAAEAPVAQYPSNPAPESPTVTYFYDSLAPYGSWVQTEDYGWAWQPTVAVVNSGWRPYTDQGRWLWSDSGWYWYSDYSWGWAPFHYGRWYTHPHRGWVWVPDTCWGPSWVTWSHTSYYCGCAPLTPDFHFVQGLGLHYRSHQVAVDFDFGYAPGFYTWIHLNRFCDPYPHHYFVPRHQIRDFSRDSVIVNNIHVSGGGAVIVNDGIGFQRISRATRSDIPRLAVVQAPPDPNRGGRLERLENHGDRLAIVRPPPPGPGQPRPESRPGIRPSDSRQPGASNLSPGLASRPSPPASPSRQTPGIDRTPVPPATASRARPVLPSRLAPAQPNQPRPTLSSLLAETKNAPSTVQPANRQPPANTERGNGAAPTAPASLAPASPNITRAPSQTPTPREPGVLNRPVKSAAGTAPQEPSRPAPTPPVASAPQGAAPPAPTSPANRPVANRPAASSPKTEPQRAAPVMAQPFQPRTDRNSSISSYQVQQVQPAQRTLSGPVNSAPVARPPAASSRGFSPSMAPRSAETVRSVSPSPRPSAPAMSAPSSPQREFRSAPVMRSEPPAVRSAPAEVRSAPSAPSPTRSAPAPSPAPASRDSSSGKSGKRD